MPRPCNRPRGSRRLSRQNIRRSPNSPDSEGADYEGMKEFERSGEYSLVAATEWYRQRAFSSVETIASLLRVRHLGATFSDSIALGGP